MLLPKLELERVVVLAGAGVSVPSGIASGQMFNDYVLDACTPKAAYAHDFQRFSAGRGRSGRPLVRFEQLVGILRDFIDPELSILNYLEQSWQPTGLHDWLAEAIRRGARVLTTNLDSLTEVAYRQLTGCFVEQVADIHDWVKCLLDCPAEAVFKVHGTLRRGELLEQSWDHIDELNPRERAIDTLGVTLDAIGRLEPSPTTFTGGFLLPEYVMRVLEGVLSDRHLVVIGYSGSDDFDVKLSLRQLRSRYRRIVWIAHADRKELVCKQVGQFLLIRGPTLEALDAMFGSLPRRNLNLAGTAARRFEEFFAQWISQVRLDDTRRPIIYGEILRQAGYFLQAAEVWQDAFDQMSDVDIVPRGRLALHLGRAYIAGHVAMWAVEPLRIAAELFDKIGDEVSAAEAGIAIVTALHDEAVLKDRSPDEVVNRLAGLMPRIHEVRLQLEEQEALFEWPADVRHKVADQQRRLEAMLMAGALTLSRIMRYHNMDSPEFVRQVTGQCRTIDDLLQEYGRLPSVHGDKLLYARYLAELSLVLVRAGRFEEHAQRHRELSAICRLLGVHFQLAMYLIDLAIIVKESEPSKAASLYSRARVLFKNARHRPGMIVAARGEAQMRGTSPDEAEIRVLLETPVDDSWVM